MLTPSSKIGGQEVGPSGAYIVSFDQLFFTTHEKDLCVLQFQIPCCWNAETKESRALEIGTKQVGEADFCKVGDGRLIIKEHSLPTDFHSLQGYSVQKGSHPSQINHV